MIQILCLFFPPIISVYIVHIVQKQKLDLIKFLYTYCFYTLIINIIIIFILKIKYSILIFNEQLFTINFIFKYLIVAVILSISLPNIYRIFRKNIQLEFIILSDNEREEG